MTGDKWVEAAKAREDFAEWCVSAGIRAVKTGAQTLAALIGTGAVGITELDWPGMLGVTATTMVLSILTSIAGVPEVADGKSATKMVKAIDTTRDMG